MKSFIAYILLAFVAVVTFVACDAKDDSLAFEPQYFPIGEVTWDESATVEQRMVVSNLLNHMVKVESCQFLMGLQASSTSRANYALGFAGYRDSVKHVIRHHVDGTVDETFSPYADRLHLNDMKVTRRKEGEQVMLDTTYYTLVYRMPEASKIWVGPVSEVSMNYDYYIGMYEVTQREWMAVMGDQMPTGRYCKVPTTKRDSAWYGVIGKGDNVAAYNIWYEDALAFCDRLNQMLNLTAASPRRFRLPTEAEWECAARGGRYSHGYRYPGSDTYTEVAWAYENASLNLGVGDANYGVHRVGQAKPNELGLYDMAGNVSEWMLNTYYCYSYKDSIAPQVGFNPVTDLHVGCYNDTLVLRGGSWTQQNVYSFSPSSRQDFIRKSDPEKFMEQIPHCGFRIVFSK